MVAHFSGVFNDIRDMGLEVVAESCTQSKLDNLVIGDSICSVLLRSRG